MRVDGTPYETILTGSGYHVYLTRTRALGLGYAPKMLRVAGPFKTRDEARLHAEHLTEIGQQLLDAEVAVDLPRRKGV